jgi:two-component system nitrate/nitrite sensor histidine kinase NarX
MLAYQIIIEALFGPARSLGWMGRIESIVLGAIMLIVITVAMNRISTLQGEATAISSEYARLAGLVEERHRLSSEIHDRYAQTLSAILLRLRTLKDLLRRDNTAAVEIELQRLEAICSTAHNEARDVLVGLRVGTQNEPFSQSLAELTSSFAEIAGVDSRLEMERNARFAADFLPLTVTLQLSQIVREALSNIRKHAAAKTVVVRLQLDAESDLVVSIIDDGRGFDARNPRTTAHLGQTVMRERADMIGASLRLESELGAGTSVVITLPTEKSL